VCRRAERKITSLVEADPELAATVIPYVNRLSDLLFTLARAANQRAGRPETAWLPRRGPAETAGSQTDRGLKDSE